MRILYIIKIKYFTIVNVKFFFLILWRLAVQLMSDNQFNLRKKIAKFVILKSKNIYP